MTNPIARDEFEWLEPQTTGDDSFLAAVSFAEKLSPRTSITGGSISDILSGSEDVGEFGIRTGIDWLKVYVYASSIDKREQREKEYRERREAASEKLEERYFDLDGVTCEMRPHGVGKFQHAMPFFFHGGGAAIAIAEQGEPGKRKSAFENKERPVAMVEFPGTYCYGQTIETLLNEVYLWCSRLGLQDVEARISRLDLAVDVEGRHVKCPAMLKMMGAVTTVARKSNVYYNGRETEGLQYGAGGAETKLRIYDKTRELATQPAKQQAYENAFGSVPEALTRYEWQLSSKALRREHGITDIEQLRGKVGAVLCYLMSRWYRETDPTDDSRNVTERDELAVWTRIREAAVSNLGGIQERRNKETKAIPVVEPLISQALGCLTSAAATLQIEVKETGELLAAVWEYVVTEFEAKKERATEKLLSVRAKLQYPGQITSPDMESSGLAQAAPYALW